MVEVTKIRAVLFAKDLSRMANFYSESFGMESGQKDEYHAVLTRGGFDLIIHQIPSHIATGIEIAQPPVRREAGSVRLDYPVDSIADSRSLARSLGGEIDEVPPAWADRGANFFLGHDPEGNVFGVSQQGA